MRAGAVSCAVKGISADRLSQAIRDACVPVQMTTKGLPHAYGTAPWASRVPVVEKRNGG